MPLKVFGVYEQVCVWIAGLVDLCHVTDSQIPANYCLSNFITKQSLLRSSWEQARLLVSTETLQCPLCDAPLISHLYLKSLYNY